MVDPSKDEERALSRDELELVSTARHPHLRDMSDRDLSELVSRLRDRRDRARTMADQQRREMRGKASPTGAFAAADNGGTRSKEHYLGAALARAMEERERRAGKEHAMQDKDDYEPQGASSAKSQHDLAEKALEMRELGAKDEPHPEDTPTPNEGLQPNHGHTPDPSIQQDASPEVVHKTRTPR